MGAALSLVANVAVPLGGGFTLGLLTKDEIPNWYAKLSKPSWTPPNPVFPAAWSLFYTTMGVAAFITARTGGAGKTLPLALYGAQLALNFAWTPLFFKAHKLDASLVDIIAMLGVATAASREMARTTGKPQVIWPLMGPYLGWLAYATALNAEILRRNTTETLLDWRRVGDDVDKATAGARGAAKEAASKAAAAAQEAAARVAATAESVASEVRGRAQDSGAEVKRE